jgi:hypothetical protein
MGTTQDGDATVGTEQDNSAVPGDWADVYAFVDDGEHARVWCVKRTSDYEVAVTAFDYDSGLAERDGTYGKKRFEVDADTSTDRWARRYAKNHQGAIKLARARFNADE